MMKRFGSLLTMILGAAVMAALAGCGKWEDREPATNAASGGASATATNAVSDAGTLSLTGGRTMPEETTTNAALDIKTLLLPGGLIYEGEIADGKPNGQGTLMDANGTHQKGEWRNGGTYKVSGTWVMTDGTKEVGSWAYDGSQSGGTIWWVDGRMYKGDWKLMEGSSDLPDGMGTMTWVDGRQYVGHFRDGKMDGAGKMTYPGGKTEDGTWSQDSFQGPAK